MKRIVVVGAGFGGLEATADLDRMFRADAGVEIILISDQNYLLFTPLLPQIASSFTDPRHIVQAVREIRGKRRFRFRRETVRAVDPGNRRLVLESGPFEYDAPHKLAMRTVTMLLQSRLFDTIRQDLGGTYSITANLETQKFPRPQYAVRIEWTCDPARTDSLVQRVWQEIAFVRDVRLSAQQLMAVRGSLLRDFEQESQENGYLLNAIARDYDESGGKNVADVERLPDQIAALTSTAIHDAARTYLNAANSVTVIQNPERR